MPNQGTSKASGYAARAWLAGSRPHQAQGTQDLGSVVDEHRQVVSPGWTLPFQPKGVGHLADVVGPVDQDALARPTVLSLVCERVLKDRAYVGARLDAGGDHRIGGEHLAGELELEHDAHRRVEVLRIAVHHAL